MSRKKIVAGNWKMNLPGEDAVSMVKSIVKMDLPGDVSKIFFPPFPFISEVSDSIKHNSTFFCGAQNCSEHDKGAYTGEVSAGMLKLAGATHVLIGHSERRAYFKETGQQLHAKLNQCVKNGLTPVFCFGELLADRKSAQHFNVVNEQLKVLSGFHANEIQDFILAYEPVWAIGTGETASPQQAGEMHGYVRTVIAEMFGAPCSENITILYGGSCNAQNAKELFACKDVDGGLIGGASLKEADFCSIIRSFA